MHITELSEHADRKYMWCTLHSFYAQMSSNYDDTLSHNHPAFSTS